MAKTGYIHTVYLDKKFSRNDTGGNHWIGSQIKGWRFAGSNAKVFEVFVASDPVNGSDEAVPAHLVKVWNHGSPAQFGCFENKKEQPGVFVQFFISPEDEIVWTPTDEESGGAMAISEGSVFSNESVTVDNSADDVVCTNDPDRVVTEISNYSSETVWLGTLASVANANYQDLCFKLAPGEMYPWRIKLALFGRTETATAAKLNLLHKKGA